MTEPWRRHHVPPAVVERLLAAREAKEAAIAEAEEAIVDALRHGVSYNDVAELMGMSNAGVYALGKRYGWPTEAELERRERMKTPEHQFDYLYPEKWAAAEKERFRIAKAHEREQRRKLGR